MQASTLSHLIIKLSVSDSLTALQALCEAKEAQVRKLQQRCDDWEAKWIVDEGELDRRASEIRALQHRLRVAGVNISKAGLVTT